MEASQVINDPTLYGALPVAERDGMLPWLAKAARELRKERDRKPVQVAASLRASESTVWRFENAKGWPEQPDAMIAAYADDLDLDPLVIWEHAVELWRANDLSAADALEQDEEQAVQRAAESDAGHAPSARTHRQKDEAP